MDLFQLWPSTTLKVIYKICNITHCQIFLQHYYAVFMNVSSLLWTHQTLCSFIIGQLLSPTLCMYILNLVSWFSCFGDRSIFCCRIFFFFWKVSLVVFPFFSILKLGHNLNPLLWIQLPSSVKEPVTNFLESRIFQAYRDECLIFKHLVFSWVFL